MKYLCLTLKNIQKFITSHTVLFLFLILVQVICCAEVFISSGLAYNMNYVEKKEERPQFFAFSFIDGDKESVGISVSRSEDGELTYTPSRNGKPVEEWEYAGDLPFGEYKSHIEKLIERTEKYQPGTVSLRLYPDKKFKASDGPAVYEEYYTDPPQFYHPYYINTGKREVYYDIKEYIETTEHIFFADLESKLFPHTLGEILVLNGTEFKCVGEFGENYIPYNAVPDNFVIDCITVVYKEKLTQNDIDDIMQVFEELFPIHTGDSIIPEPTDPDSLQLSTMLFVVAAIVMIIVILAIAKFYSFVLSERKNSLMIMRLCGCTRGKVHLIYMSEIFLTMLVSAAIGFLIFRYALFGWIVTLYPSFEEFFIPQTYIIIIVSYLLIAMLILAISVIPSTRVSITEMKRN